MTTTDESYRALKARCEELEAERDRLVGRATTYGAALVTAFRVAADALAWARGTDPDFEAANAVRAVEALREKAWSLAQDAAHTRERNSELRDSVDADSQRISALEVALRRCVAVIGSGYIEAANVAEQEQHDEAVQQALTAARAALEDG